MARPRRWSRLFQVVLIAVSAVWIAYRSVERLMAGAETSAAPSSASACRSSRWRRRLALIAYQRRVVARTGSVAIAADRAHYQSDLLLNLSVIAALVLDQLLGLVGADAVFGLLIAAWLLFGALALVGHSINQLMDREWPEAERAAFLAAAAEFPELDGLHDLRTRTSGSHHFVQFHVWVPGDWTVREAHDRLDAVEEALQARFPRTEILIHLDPHGHTDRETMLPSHLTENAAMIDLALFPGRRLCRPAVRGQSGGGHAARPVAARRDPPGDRGRE